MCAVNSEPTAGVTWGDWRLDDLVQALRRTTQLITRSAEVRSVSLYAPGTAEDLSMVQVQMMSREAVDRARDSIVNAREPAHFGGDMSAYGFTAEVDDVFLDVRCFPAGES